MIDVALLTSKIWDLIQPILGAVVAKGIEGFEKHVAEIWNMVKNKFNTKAAAKEVLEDILKDPDNPMVQKAFQYQLQKLLQEDEGFAKELSKLSDSVNWNFVANNRDGAIAQGNKSKAVGKGGVLIEGNVNGVINTGNDNFND
jgi:hypothetical protein